MTAALRWTVRAAWAGALLAAVPSGAWAQAPAGGEFQVNAYTTGYQESAAVAADANGRFVVVWTSRGQDGSQAGVFGRRFSAAGGALGGEFPVSSFTTGAQDHAAVAAAADGSFVVVWDSLQDYSQSSLGVFAQRYEASGAAQGGEFQVNTYERFHQYQPALALGADGRMVVVWASRNQDGDGNGVFGQRFDATGSPVGGEFAVNTYTTGFQQQPSVALAQDGSFVVAWSGYYQDGDAGGIFARRFDASGTPLGAEFRVNAYTTGAQVGPAVAAGPGGSFVVAWRGVHDGSGYGVFGRRFDSLGSPQGGEFQVNTFTTANQFSPVRVAGAADGSFFVVWNSVSQDGSSIGIFGRRYDGSGAPQGSDFQVNTFTVAAQRTAAIACDPDGDYVVVWQSFDQDGSADGVFAQRYGDLIFQDGFESADLSRWSSASTDGGDLTAHAAAALGGTAVGLQAVVDDTNALFVRDDTPVVENRYRAGFHFDPQGFDPGEANGFRRIRILIAFNGSNERLVTLVLRRLGGAYSVRARVRLDDGTRADTPFVGITDAPHFVELDWQRATPPGAANGQLALWIDDLPVASLGGLDNDGSGVEFVRLGAMTVKAGASGTLLFDQFESRRLRPIGPE